MFHRRQLAVPFAPQPRRKTLLAGSSGPPTQVRWVAPDDIVSTAHISDQTRRAHWQSMNKLGTGGGVLIGHGNDGIALG